jgi:glucose-6-phosphate isomerase
MTNTPDRHSPLPAALAAHGAQLRSERLTELFARDPGRAGRFAVEAAGLLLDFSKNFCTDTTLRHFVEWTAQCGLRQQIDALFSGADVNFTEGRPALHTALRATRPDTPQLAAIQAVQQRMQRWLTAVSSGERRGFSGKPITDIVNIGIGGSDLGPRLMVAALQPWRQRDIGVHFVTNIDPADLDDTLAALDPATTLFIVASKSFTTLETRANGQRAKRGLEATAAGRDCNGQLAAITASPERAAAYGIDADSIFPMWDWVGGRFSVWSAIGLAVAAAVGWDHFSALQRGALAMDEHYRTAPFNANMPVLMALLECWYSAGWGAQTAAVLPYSHRLALFPAFLQQLSMESLGKSTDRHGQPLDYDTGAVVWGEPGSNCQHSFMQLLHQGTRFVPVDFIAVAGDASCEQTIQLYASCLSQSRVLMTGQDRDTVLNNLLQAGMPADQAHALAPHKVMPGNRPSNTLLMDALTPASLGALIALYEHKVHAQSVLWNINAFDQWGVELGKHAADQIFTALTQDRQHAFDGSTEQLIARFRRRGH